MLLNLRDIYARHNLHITGVIHVGAHLAEEAQTYHDLGIEKVIWIEANPEVIPKIHAEVDRFGHSIINALVMDGEHDDVPFHVTNYDGMSSSIYEWGTHTLFSPDTIHVNTLYLHATSLDKLAETNDFSGCNMLYMDIEGAELLALQGARRLMHRFDYLYLEIRTDNVYVGAPLVDEVDRYVSEFARVETGMSDPAVQGWADNGWGDALYIRQRPGITVDKPFETAPVDEPTRFVVFVPAYNIEHFLVRCLESIRTQDYDNFEVLMIDDCSSDGTGALMDGFPFQEARVIHNQSNKKMPFNLTHIRSGDPNDVVVIVDGDDYLPHDRVLAVLDQYYRSDPSLWLTYGSYTRWPDPNYMPNPAIDYPDYVKQNRSYRNYDQIFNHPVTFRRWLFNHIADWELQDDLGLWFQAGYDCVLMMPLLELAGKHWRYLPDILYTYNEANPTSDAKIRASECNRAATIVRQRPQREAL